MTPEFYAASGFALMIGKYLIDALVIWCARGVVWRPIDYLNPSGELHLSRLGYHDSSTIDFLFVLALWTLPFAWIGLSMSVRRALDAGRSPWLGFLFLVPVVNYVAMLGLCLAPSNPRRIDADAARDLANGRRRWRPEAIFIPAGVGWVMTPVSVYGLKSYGLVLFIATPIVMGALSGFLANRGRHLSIGRTLVLAQTALLTVGGTLLLFAIEGVVCLIMATPLAVPLVALGALLGRAIARLDPGSGRHAAVLVLLLPLLAAAEQPRPHLHEVITVVDVAAPADLVWTHVVSFADLPPPTEWYFRGGIAYPMRARIDGRGVGAVRHCEFSTGAFVEPITVWDEPRRLAFDVTSQPPPMHEWSPYAHVNAPHLVGNMQSRHGEFVLTPLDDHHTRLEGHTWYELALFPEPYWLLWGDALIHRIHERVLQHVRSLAEHDVTAARTAS